MGITIPASNGGLFLNGVSASTNSAITGLNIVPANGSSTTAQFGAITQTSTGVAPFISVSNTFNPNTVAMDTGLKPFAAPDITVLGALTNLGGDLTLEIKNSTGDIQISAQVRAKNMAIVTGGNVFIDGVTAFSVGGEALSTWKTVTDLIMSGTDGVAGDATTQAVKDAIAVAKAAKPGGTVVGYENG